MRVAKGEKRAALMDVLRVVIVLAAVAFQVRSASMLARRCRSKAR